MSFVKWENGPLLRQIKFNNDDVEAKDVKADSLQISNEKSSHCPRNTNPPD